MGDPMETASFSVPMLDTSRRAADLSNAINSMNGVGAITTDLSGHTISVEYDSNRISRGGLQEIIEHSGYPVSAPEAGR